MNEKRKVLGKGLAALIPPARMAEVSREALLCPVEELKPNRRQPRSKIDPKRLEELARSIKEKGIIQPVIVRKLEKGYEIIAGERRWRAAIKAGLSRIPVVVKEASDADSLELALIENLHRDDLNPLEEAHAYRHLMEDFLLSQEEIARRVGKDRSTVANSLRLLRLPPSVQDALSSDAITSGHARALLSLPTAHLQERALKVILKRGLSVRQVEAMVQHVGKTRTGRRLDGKRKKIDPELLQIADEMKRLLGTQVRIHDRGGRGRIEIEYYSWEDIDRILERIRG